MANTYGKMPGPVQAPALIPRVEVPCGLTLTAISGGKIDLNDFGAADTVNPTVGGVALLTGAYTFDTSLAVSARALCRAINNNAANHDYWAQFDGTQSVLIWPQDGSASDASAVLAVATGCTPTVTNMNSYQAFVAATRWDSGNYGADAFADTKMYRIGFDFARLQSLNSGWTLTAAEAWEGDFTTEDQTLSLFIGMGGVITLGSSAVKKTMALWSAMQGHLSLFIQSGAAQNPVYALRLV